MNDVRRGVYILPNLFTTASLLCGFYAMVQAISVAMKGRQDFANCALAIMAAALFDGMDGRIARKTKTASRFGMEYDSLADVVSFGVAPALLLYVWALRDLGRIGWLGAFLYLACGALRLARFNVQSKGVEKNYFEGLPIPMAAMMMAGSVLIWEGRPIGNWGLVFAGDVSIYLLLLTYFLAGLMVSAIPYRSIKTLHLTGRHPFYSLVFVVFGFVIWATKPWWVLFLMGCAYVISGPIEQYVLPPPVRAFHRVKRRRRVKKALKRLDSLTSGPISVALEKDAHRPKEPRESDSVVPFRKP